MKNQVNSYLDGMFNRQKCFCAFCKSERTIYKKKSSTYFNWLTAGVGAGCLTFIIWRDWHPLGLVFWTLFIGLSEIFVRMRWRISMVCKYCGFDPILYLKDSDAAAEKVRLHLEKRKEKPETILAAPLNIPSISKTRAQTIEKIKKDTKGALLSRQV